MSETLNHPDAEFRISVAELAEPHPLTSAELALLLDGAEAAAPGAAATPTASPGSPGEAAGAALAAQKVTALWAEQSNRNAWAHFATAGWKRLSPLTDTGSTTMALLAAHARATGNLAYADENPRGTIATMYVW